MPRLEVNGKGPLAFATTLVDVPCRVVEDTEHRHDTVCNSIRPLDTGAVCTDVRTVDADTTRPLGDVCTLLERLVDTVDGIILHRHQEAGRHLRAFCTGVEQRGRRMRKVLLAHQVVRLLDARDVIPVDSDCDTHEKILGRLTLVQVPLLECLDSKVSKVVIALVHNLSIQLECHALHEFIRHDTLDMQGNHSVRETLGAILLEV